MGFDQVTGGRSPIETGATCPTRIVFETPRTIPEGARNSDDLCRCVGRARAVFTERITGRE